MKSGRIIYSLLFCIVVVAVAVSLSSFSLHKTVSTLPDAVNSPVANLLPAFNSGFYDPDFNLNADSVIIPMKTAGHLFLIEAKVDGEVGNLVFDTGASGLVINSSYFRNHVKSGGTTSTGITGSVGNVEQISIGQIEFADLTYRNLRADMANLGHIENRRGVKILGLIGFGMMRNLEIVIDPINSELKLFRIDQTGKRLNGKGTGFKPDYSQKIEGNTNILFLKGTIRGKVLNFCFDTGAETNAISSDCNKKIMSTLTITRRTVLKGTGTAGSEVLFGKMNDFVIGNHQIRDMETIISNMDALSEAFGTHIDGLLGFSFMKNGVLCINFVNKQFGIRFKKGEEK
ncbi:MAG TPA: hypothetical protein DCL77_08760 [Prolixibacteraceae bacterium]|jgi:predicted aspartyl protease|nr:hypothetical protein [Prolixibacteraceae bacterium]